MSILFTDKVQILTVTRNTTYGTNTLSDPKTSVAYIEDDTSIRFTGNGELAKSIKLIMLPKDTNVAIGDHIRILKHHGLTLDEEYVTVQRVSRIGGSHVTHLEVLA